MTQTLAEQDLLVSEHYENNIIDYEKIRLEQDSPVEFAITLRALDTWIKDRSTVLDIGVGVGHYAAYLAKRGCNVHLADICESLLKLAQERLSQEGLSSRILSATRSSATHLYSQVDESVDAVLMLGPLYHITDLQQRKRAVQEAYRVLKKDGVLFAAGINRIATLHELFQSDRYFDGKRMDIQKLNDQLHEYCKTGVSNTELFPPLGDAYCCTVDEFQSLFSPLFSQLDLLGVESFSGFNQKKFSDYSPLEQSIWLSIIEKTARTIEGVASSEHFLYVGRKA